MRWLWGSLGLRASSPLPPLTRFPFPQGGRLISGSCFAVAGIGGEVVGSLFMKASLPLWVGGGPVRARWGGARLQSCMALRV